MCNRQMTAHSTSAWARLACLTLGLMTATASTVAQMAVPTEAARNTPFVGAMRLNVDASQTRHGVVEVRQNLPVHAGRNTLYFPRFLPGTHGPYGAVHRLAGLTLRAGGSNLAWQRDTVDTFAFHVDIPAGATTLDIEFQYLMPDRALEGDSGVMTQRFVSLPWSQLLLYPVGHHVGAVPVDATLKLPPGWKHATSLKARDAGPQADTIAFETTSLELLADSPVFAAPHMVRHALDDAGAANPVTLNIFAGSEDDLRSDAAQIDAHKRLVQQADRLFGTRHFERYEFLLGLYDDVGFDGLEHHQSSENIVNTKYFKDWPKSMGARELLPHEFAHSWNGKFRRPADLLTPDFHTPTRNSLLWLYEGQTEYWGSILAVRSGLTTPEQLRDSLARTIAYLDAAPGSRWRNLQDTTNQGAMRGRTLPKDWPSWQRDENYYDEAALIWLEADMLIRNLTADAKSLDDFARGFFGVEPGRVVPPLPYTFDDVVAALNAVAAHDWRAFLLTRVQGNGKAHLAAGVQRAGWALTWADKPSEYQAASTWRGDDFTHSLGLRISSRGNTHKITSLLWEGPAYKAGVPRQGELLAVNGMVYSADRLMHALRDNKDGSKPITLIVKDGDHVHTVVMDHRSGPRYPALQRVEGAVDRLEVLFKAR